MMKIFLITDIHNGEDTNDPKHKGPEYINSFGAQFKSFIPDLREKMTGHDLIVNLGDLIYEHDRENDMERYRQTMELLSTDIPTKYVMGNHDIKFLSRQDLAALIGEQGIYYAFDLGGYHHIVLDANRRAVNGVTSKLFFMDEEQLEWLRMDLRKTSLKTVVYCHYPVDTQDMSANYYFGKAPEYAFPLNKDAIRNILEASGKVLAIFSGHVHFAHQMEINGIQHVTVPAFSENDGSGKPQATCLSVTLDDAVRITAVPIHS